MWLPDSAYKFCRDIGLNHEQAKGITMSWSKFEYFMKCIGAYEELVEKRTINDHHIQSNERTT